MITPTYLTGKRMQVKIEGNYCRPNKNLLTWTQCQTEKWSETKWQFHLFIKLLFSPISLKVYDRNVAAALIHFLLTVCQSVPHFHSISFSYSPVQQVYIRLFTVLTLEMLTSSVLRRFSLFLLFSCKPKTDCRLSSRVYRFAYFLPKQYCNFFHCTVKITHTFGFRVSARVVPRPLQGHLVEKEGSVTTHLSLSNCCPPKFLLHSIWEVLGSREKKQAL